MLTIKKYYYYSTTEQLEPECVRVPEEGGREGKESLRGREWAETGCLRGMGVYVEFTCRNNEGFSSKFSPTTRKDSGHVFVGPRKGKMRLTY